jgi:hypothetical protein
MPNLESLIETGAEYQISLLFGSGSPYPLLTCKDFDANDSVGAEEVFAVGNSTAIALKKNNYSYKGTFTLQSGEVAALCVAQGIASLVQGVELSSLLVFGANVQLAENYIDVLLTGQDKSISSTSKETPVKIAFMARTKKLG